MAWRPAITWRWMSSTITKDVDFGAPISVEGTARIHRAQELVNKVAAAWLQHSSKPRIPKLLWLCDLGHYRGAGSIHHVPFLVVWVLWVDPQEIPSSSATWWMVIRWLPRTNYFILATISSRDGRSPAPGLIFQWFLQLYQSYTADYFGALSPCTVFKACCVSAALVPNLHVNLMFTLCSSYDIATDSWHMPSLNHLQFKTDAISPAAMSLVSFVWSTLTACTNCAAMWRPVFTLHQNSRNFLISLV